MWASIFTLSLSRSKLTQGYLCKVVESASGRTGRKYHKFLVFNPLLSWLDTMTLSSEGSNESHSSTTGHRHLVRLRGAVVHGKGASAALWSSSLLN